MVRGMLGCSLMVAIAFFAVAMLVTLFIPGGSFLERLGLAGGLATIAFVASLVLCARDQSRQIADFKSVRKWLESHEDRDEIQFLAEIEPGDHELAVHLRRRLSEFFEVPVTKIHAADDLSKMKFDAFMPPIYLFLMAQLCQRHGIEQLQAFPQGKLDTVRDLVQEAKAQLRKPA